MLLLYLIRPVRPDISETMLNFTTDLLLLYYSSERPVRPDISEMLLLSRLSTLRFANVFSKLSLLALLVQKYLLY